MEYDISFFLPTKTANIYVNVIFNQLFSCLYLYSFKSFNNPSALPHKNMDVKDCFHISVITYADTCHHIFLINYHLRVFSGLRLKCSLNCPLCLLLFFSIFSGFVSCLVYFIWFLSLVSLGFFEAQWWWKIGGLHVFVRCVCIIWNQCWWIWRLGWGLGRGEQTKNSRLFENYSIYFVFHSYYFLKFTVSLMFLSIMRQFPVKTQWIWYCCLSFVPTSPSSSFFWFLPICSSTDT